MVYMIILSITMVGGGILVKIGIDHMAKYDNN